MSASVLVFLVKEIMDRFNKSKHKGDICHGCNG